MGTTDERWTILKVLDWTTTRFSREGLPCARLDAELLLAHALGVQRVRLYMDFDKPLRAGELNAFRGYVQRRLAREPVAYITGEREFWSLPFTVTPAVLIPRPETETLVEHALALAREIDAGTIVDVGTGSGAIAVVLARELPSATVLATDVDVDALKVAAQNTRRHAVTVALHVGDLCDALPETVGSLDLVVANLPYVERGVIARLEPEVARWEPHRALDGGADGLDLLRRLVPQAAGRLRAGGGLALEIGSGQGKAVTRLLDGAGFSSIRVERDLAGLDRVVTGVR